MGYLNKIKNMGDSTISSLIQDNLIEFFDWGMLDAGGFFDITQGKFGKALGLTGCGKVVCLVQPSQKH